MGLTSKMTTVSSVQSLTADLAVLRVGDMVEYETALSSFLEADEARCVCGMRHIEGLTKRHLFSCDVTG